MKKNVFQIIKEMEEFDQKFFKATAILLVAIFLFNVLALVFTQQKLVEAHPELLFANLLLLIFAQEVWDCSKPFDHASQEENTTELWKKTYMRLRIAKHLRQG